MTAGPRLCVACHGTLPSDRHIEYCEPCWAAELQARTAAIEKAHPGTFGPRRKGLRDRRFNGV